MPLLGAFLLFVFFIFIHLFIAMVHMGMPESNAQEVSSFLPPSGPRDRTQAIRPGIKHLLFHLAGPHLEITNDSKGYHSYTVTQGLER